MANNNETREEKFTPGPWAWQYFTTTPGTLIALHARDRTILTLLRTRPMEWADAHLIAAAPDLYGMLKKLTESDDAYWVSPDGDVLLDQVNALLAKARGEAVGGQ